ncbi:MAG: hypothetical protein N2Z20_03465 [Elusimicrobiales bacterium]|nr:hypothetical protein [Elusimicrobiales bacterium]
MSIWKNAFVINKGRELNEEEKKFIIGIIKKIKERKLEGIALLIAEGTKPFHNITANLIYFSKPVFGFIFSQQDLTKIAEIIENPKGLEFFKSKLEEDKNE